MITAIVLAAGLSSRMGTQKLLLPWGNTTVIGKVITTLTTADVVDIHVVTGGMQAELKEQLKGYEVDLVFNPDYANGEMLTSIQVGLRSAGDTTGAILVVLGDQPQIETQVVTSIMDRYQATQHELIVPSYHRHRGHPWLLGRKYWEEILSLKPPLTLRDFLNQNQAGIDYVTVETASIIQDLDTQQDYSQSKP